MEADADAGLNPDRPRGLVHGKTLLARLHQFAGPRLWAGGSRAGPRLVGGAAKATTGATNAIIRREAFTSGPPACPRWRAASPRSGGHILSHDFVEAAPDSAGAGWSVIIARRSRRPLSRRTPPSIIDFAVRGPPAGAKAICSMARIVSAAGLHWVSRFHLLTGIFSYVASLLWLLLIVVGLALAVQRRASRPPDYFQEPLSALPRLGPQVDPEARGCNSSASPRSLLLGPEDHRSP